MNNTISYILRLLCLFPLFGVISCTDDYTEEYLANTPYYLSYEDLRSSVKFDNYRDIMKPGRIYFKGDTLFIVENYVGIHVLRVNDPAKPERTGFINVPGCTDLCIRNNILYANSYVDLVGMDISDLSNIRETARKTDIFEYAIPKTDNDHPIYEIDKTKGVVINWEVKRVSNDLEINPIWYSYPSYDKDYTSLNDTWNGSSGGASVGTSGSMATFGLYDRYLYILTNYYNIDVFDVNSSSTIDKINFVRARGQAETMFLHDGHMFLGTTAGVDVFSLNTPSNPSYKSTYQHLTACDPVVIQDGYAYYTLRGGNACGSNINRLDVMKLSDNYLTSELIATYGMVEPYGLGIDKNVLFVCDGPAGLKVYDATDKTKIDINLLASFPDIHVYDVIPMKGYLFTIGQSGFRLFDYKDIKNIREISTIPVTGLCNVIN